MLLSSTAFRLATGLVGLPAFVVASTVWPARLLLLRAVTSLVGLAAFVDTISNLIGSSPASNCASVDIRLAAE